MLDKSRIDEAEKNVRRYLEDGLLTKQTFKKEIFTIFINNAHDSLETAEFLFNNKKSDLWIIVTAYYSMFYVANAVLLRLSYKVGDKIPHKITSDALIVFARNKLKSSLIEEYEEAQSEVLAGIKADTLLDEFDKERAKRSMFQYETTEVEKHSKAKTSLQRAKNFLFEMEKMLHDLKIN